MKKLNCTLLGLISLGIVQAQIEKGNVLLGGNFGINFQQYNNNERFSNSNLQPFVQFAYKKNRTIGFNMDLSFNSQTNAGGMNKAQSFNFGPAIQFTQFHPIKGAFGWWLQQEVGARFANNKNSNGTDEVTSKSTTVFTNVTPGIYYAVGEKRNWLLTTSVGGLYANYSGSNGADNWGVGTNLFQFYRFGFAYVFKR